LSQTTTHQRAGHPPATVDLDVLELEHVLAEVLAEHGLSAEEAGRIAHALCDAEKCGVATHGLLRVPWYVAALDAGTVTPYVRRDLLADSPALAVLDGGHAYGYQPAWEATALAADRARAQGVGIALVRGCSEFGRAAYFVRELARQGLVGFACQNTVAQIAAPGTDVAVVGNSPLAFAAPGAHGPSFDGAYTVRSGGELHRRRLLGLPVPEEWGYLDADGNPTTDPGTAIQTAQQAAGGMKGFGIALLVETLAGALTGSEHGPVPGPGSPTVGAMVMAIDPTRAGVDLAAFDAGNEKTHEAVLSHGGAWPGSRSAAARAAAEERGTVSVARGMFDACRDVVGDRLDGVVRG
jgi:LDH2 family malate/lactate/ureidoglycolate dehydrogenase